jgi:hypothetical protein
MLTDEQIRDIRREYTGTWGQQTRLADRYGVHTSTISRIVGKTKRRGREYRGEYDIRPPVIEHYWDEPNWLDQLIELDAKLSGQARADLHAQVLRVVDAHNEDVLLRVEQALS